MLQHGAYTLLIDSCYDRERFPTLAEAYEWCWAFSEPEKDAVRFVLERFWIERDGIYYQSRIEEELENYHKNSETNKKIAIDREARKRTNRAKACTNEHLTTNQEPLTTNQEPPTKNQGKSKDMPPPAAKASTKKGTRLPENWVLPKSWGEFALAEKPNWSADDVRRVAEDFRDYWLGKSGKDATKVDWLATWRKWVRSPLNEIKSARPNKFNPNEGRDLEAEMRAFAGEGNVIDGEAKDVG